MNQEQHARYEVSTLVDITKTNITTSKDNKTTKERNQQRNWETITQVLNLRTQIDASEPVTSIVDVSKLSFGSAYRGKRKVWTFTFTIEYSNVFGTKDDPFKLLRYDFEMVPIIVGLNESQLLGPPMLIPVGEYKNVHFTIEQND